MIRRRRQCEGCGARFTTFERIQLRELTVVKGDGRREAFEREKLGRSVYTAVRKRPIDGVRIEQLISGIQRQLETLGDAEVSSRQIGGFVMDGLKGLDSVAYIRFAQCLQGIRRTARFRGIRGERDRGSGPDAPATADRRVSQPPVIVLVRPQLAENIGKAARAMLNFRADGVAAGISPRRMAQPRCRTRGGGCGPAHCRGAGV